MAKTWSILWPIVFNQHTVDGQNPACPYMPKPGNYGSILTGSIL